MKALAKLDSKGRVTIPLYMREALGLRPDSYVELWVDEAAGTIVLKPYEHGDEYLIDVEVYLPAPEDLERLVRIVVNEGAEVRVLKCNEEGGKTKCVLTASVIDAKAGIHLGERLVEEGLSIIKSGPVRKGVST